MTQRDKKQIEVNEGEWYDEDFVNTAADQRIYFGILSRPGVQQWISLFNTTVSIEEALQEARGEPGKFFTMEERDPTSHRYIDIAWDEVIVPERKAVRTGYRAAELFVACLKNALVDGLHGKVDKHRLSDIRETCERALTLLSTLEVEE